MNGVGEFSKERFEISCNLLISFCSEKMLKEWLDPSKSKSTKSYIYRGSFMDCIEYLYGFIPKVFEEYCKQFGLEVYSRDGLKIGHLDVMQAMYDTKILDLKNFSLLKKLFKARGDLIHETLIEKDLYYKKLSWIVKQLDSSDLQELCKFILILCDRVNDSYRKGVSNKLIVKKRNLVSSNALIPSKSGSKNECSSPSSTLKPSNVF